MYLCDVTPSAPTLHQLLRTISLLGRWSISGPDRGASHITLRLQEIQSREWEKKEQTNNMLRLTQVQKGSYVTLCICRLTLAWISRENSTTLLECQPILTGLHSLVWTHSRADSSLCCPVSTRHSHHPSLTPSSGPFVQLSSRVVLPTSGHAEISSPKPFVWFRARTDKGIVCLADLLHSVTFVSQNLWEFLCLILQDWFCFVYILLVRVV